MPEPPVDGESPQPATKGNTAERENSPLINLTRAYVNQVPCRAFISRDYLVTITGPQHNRSRDNMSRWPLEELVLRSARARPRGEVRMVLIHDSDEVVVLVPFRARSILRTTLERAGIELTFKEPMRTWEHTAPMSEDGPRRRRDIGAPRKQAR